MCPCGRHALKPKAVSPHPCCVTAGESLSLSVHQSTLSHGLPAVLLVLFFWFCLTLQPRHIQVMWNVCLLIPVNGDYTVSQRDAGRGM